MGWERDGGCSTATISIRLPMLCQPPYRLVAGPGASEIEIKKSRFLGAVDRIASEDEARAFINRCRRAHPDANHHCSAYVVGKRGQIQHSSDDGEPAGTAGVPILSVLHKRGLTETVAVVTRYFGGTLLGAGGLIRAYGHAATAAIEAAGIVERQPRLLVAIAAPHATAGRLEHALRVSPFTLCDVSYTDRAVFMLQTTTAELDALTRWLAAATDGTLRPEVVREAFVDVPISTMGEA